MKNLQFFFFLNEMILEVLNREEDVHGVEIMRQDLSKEF